MEAVAYLFNSDFETQLFSNKEIKLESNKVTQEFEYFIHLLNPGEKIYTTRSYSSAYQNFLNTFTGKDLSTVHKTEKIIPWCQSFNQIELLKKFQNKVCTIKFLLETGFSQEEISFVNKNNLTELKANYLYKYPKAFSGMGHFVYAKDQKKIENLLTQGEVLIQEKLHQRTMDFSTLVEGGKLLCQYENLVDDHFQYKGTIIRSDFQLPEKIKTDFGFWLEKILIYTQKYKGIMSIDSYLYDDGAGEKLFPVCELNVRKTMGYVAFKLKEKYFNDMPIMKMLLVNKKETRYSYQEIKNRFQDNVFLLSPTENRFHVYCLLGNSDQAIKELELSLFT